MDNDRAQRIRTRAYFIWEKEGCPEGGALRHWDQACQEIDREEAEAGTGIAEQSDWQPAGARGERSRADPGRARRCGRNQRFRTRHRTSRGNRAAGRHRAAGWPWALAGTSVLGEAEPLASTPRPASGRAAGRRKEPR